MSKGIRLPALLLVAFALGTSMASAQTSKARLRTGQEEYLVFKRTFQNMVDRGEIRIYSEPYEGVIDLWDCSYGEQYIGEVKGSGRTGRLANLAYEIVRLKKLLTTLGYPASVWQPALVKLEEDGKERFNPHEPVHLRPLNATLAEYRRRSAPRLAKTIVEGGCGEGEVGVRFATQPGNGRLRLIPVFFFRLCEIQKIDPDDPRQCDHWREAVKGALLEVAGDYFYLASWPDGTRRTGKLSLTELEYGETITIDKQ
jgi:hypothetical protein